MEHTTDTLTNFITGINDARANTITPNGAAFTGYLEGIDFAASDEFDTDPDAITDAFATYFGMEA